MGVEKDGRIRGWVDRRVCEGREKEEDCVGVRSVGVDGVGNGTCRGS